MLNKVFLKRVQRLNWNKQADKIIHKATAVYWSCSRFFGKTLVPQARMIYWLCEAVMKSMITYALLV